jgi:TDG/mug DNA glycosylase family protein
VRVLFVGINPGLRSAEIGHHFAGYSNRFWKLLHDSGLVPEPIGTENDWRLPEWGYGITNLVARPTPGIGDLDRGEYDAGRRRLLAKIRRFRPSVVALVGVTLYRALFPAKKTGARRWAPSAVRGIRPRVRGIRLQPDSTAPRVRGIRLQPDSTARGIPGQQDSTIGLREETLAGVEVFVLPNPSGRNANFSYSEMLEAFSALRRHVDARRRRHG